VVLVLKTTFNPYTFDMGKIDWKSLNEKIKQSQLKKAQGILTQGEFEQVKIVRKNGQMEFKGPAEIIEKLKHILGK